MSNYLRDLNPRKTPQSQPIFGSVQKKNNAGGYAWEIDKWGRLERFLVLGAEGGTYYVGQQELVRRNAKAVEACIAEDGPRAVEIIQEMSTSGRVYKNDPALFALAMCASLGDIETKRAAYKALPKVARIGTHLFHFVAFVDQWRGWGRGLREAVAAWYTDQPLGRVAYQAVKYQQRDGWSHRDVLRLAHPTPPTPEHDILYGWITKGWDSVGEEPRPDKDLGLIWAYEKAKTSSKSELLSLIGQFRLTREMIPTTWLNDVDVWRALLERMPMTAMIRNLGKMTSIGLLKFGDPAVGRVCEALGNEETLKKARVHPLQVLAALVTYEQGKGFRGSLSWEPVTRIVDALDRAFYLAFQNVEPTGKRIMIALDVSASMTCETINGLPGITPRIGSAAMSLVTAATDPNYLVTAFSHGITPLSVSPRQRLDDVTRLISGLRAGSTDCALPMLYAMEHKLYLDAFVVYTDNETWAGDIHPSQALQEYRRKFVPDAKLVVVGMTSAGFSIADPNDPGMLDVVGFDAAAPRLIGDFVAGKI